MARNHQIGHAQDHGRAAEEGAQQAKDGVFIGEVAYDVGFDGVEGVWWSRVGCGVQEGVHLGSIGRVVGDGRGLGSVVSPWVGLVEVARRWLEAKIGGDQLLLRTLSVPRKWRASLSSLSVLQTSIVKEVEQASKEWSWTIILVVAEEEVKSYSYSLRQGKTG